jgi:hypothetical protein
MLPKEGLPLSVSVQDKGDKRADREQALRKLPPMKNWCDKETTSR